MSVQAVEAKEKAKSDPVFVGKAVTFVNPNGQRIPALVTAVHGPATPDDCEGAYNRLVGQGYKPTYSLDDLKASWQPPSVNVVYVTKEENRTDPYGTQIDRATSVPFQSSQTAHGYYYI